MTPKYLAALFTAISTLTVSTAVAPASSAFPLTNPYTSQEQILDQFRENLRSAADGGDSVANNGLIIFDQLSESQRTELSEYLSGIRPWEPEGNLTKETAFSANSLPTVSVASNQERSVWRTDAFKFAGITVTETQIQGRYLAQGAAAHQILSNNCTVVRNFRPLTNVTSDQSAAYVSGGNATFDCRVRVQSGVPTPWGTVDWSTKEAIQFVSGDGYGNVVGGGWR